MCKTIGFHNLNFGLKVTYAYLCVKMMAWPLRVNSRSDSTEAIIAGVTTVVVISVPAGVSTCICPVCVMCVGAAVYLYVNAGLLIGVMWGVRDGCV